MAQPLILPFVTEEAYAAWAGLAQEVVWGPETVAGGAPLAVPPQDLAYFGDAPLTYDFPAVTLTTLRDALVRGKSNLLTAPEAIVRHGLFDPATEIIPEEFYGRVHLLRASGKAAWGPGDPFAVGYLPEAAAFTDGTAFNYAHWLTEVLPRLAALVASRGRSGMPILIDTDLHPNILRSIALVAGPDVEIQALAPGEVVRVGVLHKVSVAGYVPFKLRPQPLETICHGRFGGQALRAAADRLRQAAAPAEPGGGRPKLLIRRNAALRRMDAEAELEEALARQGFVAIDPGALSLDEQIAVFSSAGMVVGPTGAAMANLIFCPPDCPIVILMPRFRHTAYWYWRRMAAAAGAGPVIHVSGPQTQATEDPWDALAVHQDFSVAVGDVLAAVEAAAALSG
jgi:capsular polysaccharide biosynthesis protein